MFYQKLIVFFIAISLVSCSNEDSSLLVEKKCGTIVVEPMSTTRSSTSDVSLYHVEYGDIVLDHVKLSDNEVQLLKSAQGMVVDSVDVYGYSDWTNWESGRPRPYRRSFSSSNSIASQCGIAAGTYFVNDVYLRQTYTFPSNLVVILDNNIAYSSNTTIIGWNPDNLSVRGFRSSLSGSTVTMETAAYLLEYTLSGQQTYRTYPVNSSNVVWKLKYIKLY